MSKSQKEYEVEKIIDKRNKPHLQYKVKWKGWSLKDSTWEPIEHLTNVLDLVHKFEKSHSEESRKRKRMLGRKRKHSPIILSSDDSDSEEHEPAHKKKKHRRDASSSDEKEEKKKFKKSKEKQDSSESDAESVENGKEKPKTSKNVSTSSDEEKPKKQKVHSASESGSEEAEKPPKRGRPKKVILSDSDDSESAKKVKKPAPKIKKADYEEEEVDGEETRESIRSFLLKSEKPEMIMTAKADSEGKIAVKVKLANGESLWVKTDVLAKTHPKLLISYYESNLKFSK